MPTTLSHTQSSRQTRRNVAELLLAGVFLLIPIFTFWYVWARFAVNVPKWDDHALKGFLFYLDQATTVPDKIYQFFAQHNEHRIVYDRLITWLDYTCFSHFNYRHLMLVGNLSLLGLIVLFGAVLNQSLGQHSRYGYTQSTTHWTDAFFYLPPVAFLLLNLSEWENMFWGMAALQNFTVLLWIFWCLYLVSFTEHIWGAILLAIAATLTSGNGLLVWPLGFGILLAQLLLNKQPNQKKLIGWGIAALVVIGLYFLGYHKPAGNPPARGSVLDLAKGWLSFTGSAAEAFWTGPTFAKCILLGSILTVLVLGSWIYLLEKGLVEKRVSSFTLFFVAATAFILITATTVAWSRVGFGRQVLITSRYKIYSLLMLVLVYLFAIVQQRGAARSWAYWLGLVFSALLMGSSYLTYLGESIWWRDYLLSQQFNWSHPTNQPTAVVDSVTSRYIEPSPAFYDSALPVLFGQANQPVAPLRVTKGTDGYVLDNTTLPAQILNDGGPYILARSAKRSYLFPVRPNQQSPAAARFLPANVFTHGFSTVISPAELPDAGTYQLFILALIDGKASLYPTNQLLESAGPPQAGLQKNW